jgi:hypothetical protein
MDPADDELVIERDLLVVFLQAGDVKLNRFCSIYYRLLNRLPLRVTSG